MTVKAFLSAAIQLHCYGTYQLHFWNYFIHLSFNGEKPLSLFHRITKHLYHLKDVSALQSGLFRTGCLSKTSFMWWRIPVGPLNPKNRLQPLNLLQFMFKLRKRLNTFRHCVLFESWIVSLFLLVHNKGTGKLYWVWARILLNFSIWVLGKKKVLKTLFYFKKAAPKLVCYLLLDKQLTILLELILWTNSAQNCCPGQMH